MKTLDPWDEELVRAFHEELHLPQDQGMAQPWLWWLEAQAQP